jgi:hypothetical protein
MERRPLQGGDEGEPDSRPEAEQAEEDVAEVAAVG